MLFYTIVARPPTAALPVLYDPLHQVMPFDALAKLVTHNFFPQRQTALVDLLLQSYLEWSSHPKYNVAYLSRIVETAPRGNEHAARTVTHAVKEVLSARAKAQNTAWVVAAP